MTRRRRRGRKSSAEHFLEAVADLTGLEHRLAVAFHLLGGVGFDDARMAARIGDNASARKAWRRLQAMRLVEEVG